MQVELARQQWQDGNRRLEAARSDRARFDRLAREVEIVAAELRQRMGQNFTLAELAEAYDDADRWAGEVLDDSDPDRPPTAEPGTVADAAFYLYARGAVDYRP